MIIVIVLINTSTVKQVNLDSRQSLPPMGIGGENDTSGDCCKMSSGEACESERAEFTGRK